MNGQARARPGSAIQEVVSLESCNTAGRGWEKGPEGRRVPLAGPPPGPYTELSSSFSTSCVCFRFSRILLSSSVKDAL